MASMGDNDRQSQLAVLSRLGLTPVDVDPHSKVGVSINLKERHVWPVNGLRHPPEGDMSGWYLWAGEDLPSDPQFFVPLHASHLAQWRPEVVPYLLLPPGWRFLIAPRHEDVWQDPSLLLV